MRTLPGEGMVGTSYGSYSYFEHQADMGVCGRGPTMEEAFSQAARAVFNLMVEVDQVRSQKQVFIRCRGNDQGELLVEWLNHLLAEADINGMVLGTFRVDSLSATHLAGDAWGEPLNPQRHRPKTEVKAATYAMLFVGREGGQYVARCVVDL
jgi:SHS2 domain-containing protein